MIRIIDRTFVCLEDMKPSGQTLRQTAALLFASGADILEVSPAQYADISGAVPNGQYILRVGGADAAKAYADCRDIRRFVCPGVSREQDRVYAEIRLNDMGDFLTVSRYQTCARVRVRGLSTAILQPVDAVLKNLRAAFRGTVELSPENDCHSATSIAVEWALSGGTDVVTSFFGMDNMAAFEDVTKALHLIKGRKAKSILPPLEHLDAELRALLARHRCA